MHVSSLRRIGRPTPAREFGTWCATGRLRQSVAPGSRSMRGEPKEFRRRLPVGAEFLPDGGVHFRVWAPKRKRVEVVLPRDNLDEQSVSYELAPEGAGYYSTITTCLSSGSLYGVLRHGE